MRGTQSSESESPRNDRPDARAVFVFSAPDACQEKEHASVDQTNAANLAIATLNLPVFNSFLRQVVIFMLLGRVLGVVGLAGWHLEQNASDTMMVFSRCQENST